MTPRPRLLFYVQHLLGIGHLVRASRLARALAAGVFDVTVVVGGAMPGELGFGAAAVVNLPPVKAGPGGFADLVASDGSPFGEPERAARCCALLGLFDRLHPDVLLIEAFPFGRRSMRFELLPLLEAAAARPDRPVVAVSVRDILQTDRKRGRDAETLALVRRYVDRVLVHGDPALARLGDTFPFADEIAERTVHTGLVGPATVDAAPDAERFDVVVSVGGGAVGADVLRAAVDARPLSLLRDAPWLVLTGPNLPSLARPAPAPGLTLRTFEPDLPARLRAARVSVSQAGYNTVADLLSAPACRPVLVPFAGGGETEQPRRAALLQARGLALSVEPGDLDPTTLARAIDRSLDLPRPQTTFNLDGAVQTGRVLERDVRARRAG